MKILIVDDEAGARETLRLLLENFISGKNEILEAESVPKAVKVIHEFNPELVFLDIEMPEYTGFDLFKFIPNPSFSVIFSTAYNEYALKAFEVSAIDYLLKPIIADRLVQAVNKVVKRNRSALTPDQIKTIKSLHEERSLDSSKLVIPVSQGYNFIRKDEILYAKADGSYTRIYLKGKDDLYLSKRLNLIEEVLKDECFVRINRSYIINFNKIAHISRALGGMVRMEDGHEISLSKEKRDFLIERFSFIEKLGDNA
ncbi:MAG: LytTR family DNA-binding domain-containing protein [Flavobacteriales bacterium]|jgi:two-component system LytT family response regulator|nr:LytTR family DNA-binding domain-containing protein [Flavobacteriales bacterium]